MRTFLEADRAYCKAVEEIGDLDSAFTAACAVGKVDLCGTGLTRAVLARLKSYQIAQELIKTFLKKRYAAAAADFFVETVAFYLNVVIKLQKLELNVASEKPVNELVANNVVAKTKELQLNAASEMAVAPRQSVMRPDISVWKGDELVAAIECKTQLGRNRHKDKVTGQYVWLQDFEKRESQLNKQRPNAKLFLLVMTESNWDGFGVDSRCGKQFFALLDKHHWPRDVDPSAATIEGLVHPNPIEKLFRLVLV
jgi:hypothetical protein